MVEDLAEPAVVPGPPPPGPGVPPVTAVPPVLPEPPTTGDAAVDAAVARLAEVAALPLEVQPAAYESVHRTLTDRLADVEG